MKTLKKIVGVASLVYAGWSLLHGGWLLCIQFGAFGWLLLIDPTRPDTVKLRVRLAWVVLACVLLRLIF